MSEIIREYKECTVVNGEIWNIGPWDYQYRTIQIGTGEDGTPITEEVATYPFPENGVIEHRWFRYSEERGWYEEGTEPILNTNDQLNRNLTELFAMLIKKNVIEIEEVPAYTEYDFKSAVQSKLSESDA